MQQPADAVSGDDTPEALAEQYAALRVELERLYSEPVRDMVAIDATMTKIDTVHVHLKDLRRAHNDPQRY